MNIKGFLLVILSLIPANIAAVICFVLLSSKYSLLINIMILVVFNLAMLGFSFLCNIYSYREGYCSTLVVIVLFVVYCGLVVLICLLPCLFSFVEFIHMTCNEFAFIVSAVVLIQMETVLCIMMNVEKNEK